MDYYRLLLFLLFICVITNTLANTTTTSNTYIVSIHRDRVNEHKQWLSQQTDFPASRLQTLSSAFPIYTLTTDNQTILDHLRTQQQNIISSISPNTIIKLPSKHKTFSKRDLEPWQINLINRINNRLGRPSVRNSQSPSIATAQDITNTTTSRLPLPRNWGLERILYRNLKDLYDPLNANATSDPIRSNNLFKSGGEGVRIYLVDSGLNPGHLEFGGRKIRFGKSFDGDASSEADSNENDPLGIQAGRDLTGHGTHVGALLVGRYIGVARHAELVSVRVINKDGSGDLARLVEAIHWIINDMQQRDQFDVEANRSEPIAAVVNLSIFADLLESTSSASANSSVHALRDVIVSAPGNILFVTIAGNDFHADTCGLTPAVLSSLPNVVSVAATTSNDLVTSFTNLGPCTNLFAPGNAIISADYRTNHTYVTRTGTSQSAPFVSASAALLWSHLSTISASQIKNILINTATNGVVMGLDIRQRGNSSDSGIGFMALAKKTPNKLLYIGSELMRMDLVKLSGGNDTRVEINNVGVQVIETVKNPVLNGTRVAESGANTTYNVNWGMSMGLGVFMVVFVLFC